MRHRLMAELGIDILKQRAKSLSEFDDVQFDYIVTLCAETAENCPIFPDGVTYIHHPFDDPVIGSNPDCASFREVRGQIVEWIQTTF